MEGLKRVTLPEHIEVVQGQRDLKRNWIERISKFIQMEKLKRVDPDMRHICLQKFHMHTSFYKLRTWDLLHTASMVFHTNGYWYPQNYYFVRHTITDGKLYKRWKD